MLIGLGYILILTGLATLTIMSIHAVLKEDYKRVSIILMLFFAMEFIIHTFL